MKRVSPCQKTETPTQLRVRNPLHSSSAAARPGPHNDRAVQTDPPLKTQNSELSTGDAPKLVPVRSPWLGNRVAYQLREYEYPIFADRTTGVVVLHWSRQIGKTFTLAAWAVDRLLTRPGRLVSVLSSSRENGSEFVARCAQICEWLGLQQLQAGQPQP